MPEVDVVSRQELAAWAREVGGHVVVLALDGLSLVDEVGGWGASDEVVAEIAARFRAVLGSNDRLGQLAADRLVVVTSATDPAAVERLVEDLSAALDRRFEVLQRRVRVSATFGVAGVGCAEGDHEDAAYRATGALEHARSTGSMVGWYDEGLHHELMQRRKLANDLIDAMEGNRLVLLYQPTYELRSGRCVGVEGLLRWEHPERGSIAPEAFLPTAERMGLAESIGGWVWSAAIEQLERWEVDRGPAARSGRPPLLWINLLPGRAKPGMANALLAELHRAGVSPSRVGVDLVQSAFTGEPRQLFDELERLRELGVRIAVDDFGTGDGSLAALRRLPVDVLKIDTSFVHEIVSRRGRDTVRAMIDLARTMDVEVIAEGVETEEQLAALRELGCDAAMGFLLGRPVPADELSEVVEAGTVLLASSSPTASPPRWRRLWTRTATVESSPDEAAGAVGRDPVTGLRNHRGLVEALATEMEAGRRPVLLLVELDGYAAAQLMWGREAMDTVLRAYARKLEGLADGRAFRVGGGRFAVYLPDTRRGHVTSQLDLIELGKGPRGLTACVGIAHAVAASTPDGLVQHVEHALAAAQRRGHGSVVDHRAGEDASAGTVTAAQARALYGLLREGYLRVHYQPIMAVRDGSLIGYQALARPQLDHGLAGPVEAFEVADALGVVPLLDEICRSSILADGPGFDLSVHERLFVTIAPQALGHRSLRSGQFVREVRAAGLEPASVVVQLRESPTVPAAIFDQEARWFKERGFAIALDDAGGQASGLRALASVPFDAVKLAPSLIENCQHDAASRAMVEALAAFCRRAGGEVIATGIETAEMLATVRSLRPSGNSGTPWVDAIQGYLVGKPRAQPRRDGHSVAARLLAQRAG